MQAALFFASRSLHPRRRCRRRRRRCRRHTAAHSSPAVVISLAEPKSVFFPLRCPLLQHTHL